MRLIFSILLAVFISACTQTTSVSEKQIKREIDSLMRVQERAWSNGDIEGFMEHYWKNDSLVFSTTTSRTYGWQQATDRYKRSYPNKDSMGILNFSDAHTKLISHKIALTTGQWKLHREKDTLVGRFTLVWKSIGDRWCIIADHSS